MRVLVTGAEGFIGKNMVAHLKDIHEVFVFDTSSDISTLTGIVRDCDFIFHLAGVNRPDNPSQFYKGNTDFTETLVNTIESNGLSIPIVFSSSAQVGNGSDYAKSKEEAENILEEYGRRTGSKVHIYRLPGVFGKWCRPNYNSVVATFCHNIANNLPITISDPDIELTLTYIDDVIDEFINVMSGNPSELVTHKVTLGRIAQLLEQFRDSRITLSVPNVSDLFSKKLHATYLSYLPEDDFSYPLKMNVDDRGSFTEILRTEYHGQFSVNIAKPGIVKGNHWHNTKNEKFLVVGGEGVIRFRHVDNARDGKVIEYHVSGNKMEVLDIPPGYTHNIENTGDVDLITFMWCNERFEQNKPDTIFLGV